jgi:two-component system, NtrC family, sensor kinase
VAEPREERPRWSEMFRRTTSIRGKITAGYAMGFVLMLVVASVLFVNLLAVEDWFASYSSVSKFLDTTLEVRRYEKNYLLYGQKEDLDAALRYTDAATAMVASGAVCGQAEAPLYRRWLRLFVVGFGAGREAPVTQQRAEELLREYRARLLRAGGGADPASGGAGGEVRDAGRTITEIAERLSAIETHHLQTLNRSGRRTLILLVLLFLLGTGVITRVVLQNAILPLKDLEGGMQRIANGEYQMLPLGTGNAEIESMHTAFNRMIREVFQHRHDALRAERLASLGTMLAGIAHEINNPLSNISTSAEILQEENETASPTERRELVQQILSQTERATRIIRTVLDYSRETRFERRPTNLLATLRSSAMLVRGRMPEHLGVAIDVPPELEVSGDSMRLQQAFINLMANGLDAMSDAGHLRQIMVCARGMGDKEVEIRFEDAGAGIPAHLLGRVFDPFFSTKDVGRGTGLGLYVTHQIIEQHAGSIRVESVVDRGTTVTVRLPRAHRALEAAMDAEPCGAGHVQ